MQKHKLLFISGFERSGTTLISNILNQSEKFLSVGELGNLWRKNLLEKGSCSCNEPIRNCPFWQQTLELADLSQQDHQYLKDNIKYTNNYYLLPQIIASKKRRYATQYQGLATRLGKVYQAINELHKAPIIVDDMKQPLYGAMLQENPAIDLFILHVVRDPRGVIYSNLKRSVQENSYYANRRFLVSRLCMVWNVVNYSAPRLFPANSRTMVMRYEDFVSDPQTALNEIAMLVGENVAFAPLFSGNKVRIRSSSHHVGGHHKFNDVDIELKPDERWHDPEVGRSKVKMVELYCRSLMKRHNYLP